MIKRRYISIERRKSEIVRKISEIAFDNMFHRAICLCNIPNTEKKLKNFLTNLITYSNYRRVLSNTLPQSHKWEHLI